MPVTVPPLNETLRAGLRPPRAASAVRTLVRTETFIPMKPAAADATAPIRNPIAAFQPSSDESTVLPRKPIRRNRTKATTPMIAY